MTDTPTDSRIAILGLGTMTGAILTGMLDNGVPAGTVVATTRSAASAQQARERYGVEVVAAEQDESANAVAAAGADIVLVGVKPKDMVATLRSVAGALKPSAVVVSVAAGVTAQTMAAVLPAGQPLVRTMPNTPLTVGSGVVGVAEGPTVTAEQSAAVRALFAGSGLVVPVPEEQLSAVVAAAGSAPAYVFLLAELIAAHGAELGLEAEAAEAMAAATVKGAGIMLQQEGARAEDLRKAVMSPNGTTEKAIEAFLDGGMPGLVNRAMDAAVQRDREMAEEFRA